LEELVAVITSTLTVLKEKGMISMGPLRVGLKIFTTDGTDDTDDTDEESDRGKGFRRFIGRELLVGRHF